HNQNYTQLKLLFSTVKDLLFPPERMNSRGCANLTLVLDNWKYAIMTQVKDLLLHDHNAVLPDYGRIQPLSDALGDLYKEFNALKEHLTELTAKFGDAEAFVDDVRLGRIPAPPRGEHRPTGSVSEAGRDSGSRHAAPRSRIIIRKIKKLSGSQH
uniref:Si:ch73-127m5.3 n=1 Tax=Nothobranchius furzeri TaxID=105023 RepID=A0A8C6W0J8_NOTFU